MYHETQTNKQTNNIKRFKKQLHIKEIYTRNEIIKKDKKLSINT